ncbi:CheW protein [Idiomarina fontislapidosi]|uniref:Chemotaxis protein CheW n=1 Tax=Idiomarina fontislapidosi TaxID=263723 RepID=A0A432YAQ8_9GAMM|nr:chemotaxis protein CheW [Idiomarina fontislapidosi]PYE35180.1 CheW protein [Idiomarina fontislapidosi]RUO58075.1 chemotaxis protein CheW [Idiomarina fontislapidosi]|tara:strand:+ start:2490 stop:3002 length:513 start_codon:yes stop_codon:yes gene_type:complete
MSATKQILSFILHDEHFGLAISHIQEVLEYRRVTAVPRTPQFLIGVTNLRGQVVPVVDLRALFGLTQNPLTINSCIIIVDITIGDDQVAVGLLADRVCEVIEIDVACLNQPPRLGNQINTDYIEAIARHEDDFIILLDLARVFSGDEISSVTQAMELMGVDMDESSEVSS